MRGIGYLSFLVSALSPLKSVQNLKEPSGFLTSSTGLAQGDLLGYIIPACSSASISALMIFCSYGLVL